MLEFTPKYIPTTGIPKIKTLAKPVTASIINTPLDLLNILLCIPYKIIKEYKKLKKKERSNLSQVKKMGLTDKDGNP